MTQQPKIYGWAADSSACGWYRIELPLAEYQRRGGDVEWSSTMPRWVLDDGADVIIGQRVALPDASIIWQELARRGKATMVLELDDDLWNIDPSNRVAHRVYTPELLDNLTANIRCADVVTVTTEQLADRVRPLNSNVRVVPNRIPGWLLNHQRLRSERLAVGWQGSVSHAMDWEDAAPQVGRFLKRNPTVQVHLMGASFPSMRSWPASQVRTTNWLASVADYYRAVDFDIALAPLKPHIFNSAKSNLRAIEMAALGVPVVASDVGPYSSIIDHGRTGYLVKRDHEWGGYLRDLVNDQALRDELGTNAHRQAADHTVENNLHSWLDAWQVPALAGV